MTLQEAKLASVILGSLQAEYMYKLEKSNGYVKELKFHGKGLMKALSKDEHIIDQYYSVDEQSVTHLTNAYQGFVRKLSKVEIEDIAQMDVILDMYFKDKEGFLAKNKVLLNSLDNNE